MKEVEETSDHKPTRATATAAAAGSWSRAARELNLPKHFRLFAFQKKKKILIPQYSLVVGTRRPGYFSIV